MEASAQQSFDIGDGRHGLAKAWPLRADLWAAMCHCGARYHAATRAKAIKQLTQRHITPRVTS